MTEQNLLLDVKIIPKSSHNQIVGIRGKYLVIKINAVAEQGKANKELIRFLSKTTGVPKSAITITKGELSPYKILTVSGLTQQKLLSLLKL